MNGQPIRFLLDTGASNSIITRSAAKRLGLKFYQVDGLQFYGVGGSDVVGAVTVDELKIAGVTAHHVNMAVSATRLDSPEYAGFLGDDILGQQDLELDFSNAAVRLIKPAGCVGDQVLYWGKGYASAVMEPSQGKDAIEVYVSLNGKRTLAEIDTGAPTSIVTLDAARRAGVTPQSEGVKDDGYSGGLGAERSKALVASFPTFTIGDETIKNAKLRISDLFAADTEGATGSHIQAQVEDLPQMLLGADFVRAHRIYVARSQGKIYFSYSGGPIFQVVGPGAERAGAAASAKP